MEVDIHMSYSLSQWHCLSEPPNANHFFPTCHLGISVLAEMEGDMKVCVFI